MSSRLGVLVALLLAPASVESGGVACPFCIAGCQAAFWGGVVGSAGPHAPVGITLTFAGYAACMASCNAAAVATTCFDGANTVMTRNGTKRISELRLGDLIATASASGELAYTHVAQNVQQTSAAEPFFFKHVALANGNAFNVTNEHFLVKEAASGELLIKRAQEIIVGDIMVSVAGARSRVVSVGNFTMAEKWALGTAAGTVMVNGVLVTAICDISARLPTNFEAALQVWRAQHKHLTVMDSVANMEDVVSL